MVGYVEARIFGQDCSVGPVKGKTWPELEEQNISLNCLTLSIFLCDLDDRQDCCVLTNQIAVLMLVMW